MLTREKYFREYVVNYTNASVILSADFADSEDLDGVFSGLDKDHRTYDVNNGVTRAKNRRPQGARGAEPEWEARVRRRHAARRTGPAARGPP